MMAEMYHKSLLGTVRLRMIVPQGLKPGSFIGICGTTEVMP
jgi:hypothetical protein